MLIITSLLSRVMRTVKEVEPRVYRLPINCIRLMFASGKYVTETSQFGRQGNTHIQKRMGEGNYVRMIRSQKNEDKHPYIRMIRSQKKAAGNMYARNVFASRGNNPSVYNIKAGLYELPSECVKFLV